MVAEKFDPTIDRICFCRIFQTLMNLEKKTMEMSLEGPKMVERRYGLALNCRKTQKSGDPSWRPPPPSLARSGRVQRLLAGKFYRRGRLVVLLLPVHCMYSSGGRNRLPRLKPDRPKNGSKRPSSRFSSFWDFLSIFVVGSSLGTQD